MGQCLNPGLASKWKNLSNLLKEMTFTVPIFYFRYFNSTTVFDVHAFSDASKRSYATVFHLFNGESSILVYPKPKLPQSNQYQYHASSYYRVFY